jgi:hypothetical protein
MLTGCLAGWLTVAQPFIASLSIVCWQSVFSLCSLCLETIHSSKNQAQHAILLLLATHLHLCIILVCGGHACGIECWRSRQHCSSSLCMHDKQPYRMGTHLTAWERVSQYGNVPHSMGAHLTAWERASQYGIHVLTWRLKHVPVLQGATQVAHQPPASFTSIHDTCMRVCVGTSC